MFMPARAFGLCRNVHTLKLKELIQAYTTVRLSFIGTELKMSADEAERLCSLLILDGKLEGWLDQVAGVLHVEEGTSGAATEARKFNGLTEWVGNLGKIRNNIGGKVVALTD